MQFPILVNKVKNLNTTDGFKRSLDLLLTSRAVKNKQTNKQQQKNKQNSYHFILKNWAFVITIFSGKQERSFTNIAKARQISLKMNNTNICG